MRRCRIGRQPRDRAVLLPLQPVVQGEDVLCESSGDWPEEPQNYNWQFDPEEWGEHAHYCDICCSNWRHSETPECRYGGAARCPEHEGEDT